MHDLKRSIRYHVHDKGPAKLRGVTWDRRKSRWKVQISVLGKEVHVKGYPAEGPESDAERLEAGLCWNYVQAIKIELIPGT